MGAIAETVRERGGVTIVDEIYLGLGYDEAFGKTALALNLGQYVAMNPTNPKACPPYLLFGVHVFI